MKRAVLFIFLSVFAIDVRTQTPSAIDLSNHGVAIEPDKRLIVVLATLDMAAAKNSEGRFVPLLDLPMSPEGAKFRERLWADNADLPQDLRLKIVAFVAQHKKRHSGQTDAEIAAPFISMAYALSPAPELGDPLVTADLPGSLLDVLDFAPLVREFYKRSAISSRLDDYVKHYKQVADGMLKTSSGEMVREILDYLHTRPQLTVTERVKVETTKGSSKKKPVAAVETRQHDRHFYIVPEMMAPKGTLNFLNIRDDYYLILPPDTDLSGPAEARRAYLRFVIDPLIYTNSKELALLRDWAKPVLDELRKTNPAVTADAFLATSRSLVAAIDIRQNEFTKIQIATDQARRKLATLKTDDQKRGVTADLAKAKQAFSDESALQLYEEYQKGNILSFYFAEQLAGIEDSGFDIAASLREMIASFDPAKETLRIASTADARKRALTAREIRRTAPDTVIPENPVTTALIAIQKTIDARDLPRAAADLKRLLAQNPSEPRIYYNIGRVAGIAAGSTDDPDAIAEKLLEAKTAYSNVLRTSTAATDKALLSLTYVALARIYEFNNETDYAMKLYEKAIEIGEVTGGALGEAKAGKQRLLKPRQ